MRPSASAPSADSVCAPDCTHRTLASDSTFTKYTLLGAVALRAMHNLTICCFLLLPSDFNTFINLHGEEKQTRTQKDGNLTELVRDRWHKMVAGKVLHLTQELKGVPTECSLISPSPKHLGLIRILGLGTTLTSLPGHPFPSPFPRVSTLANSCHPQGVSHAVLVTLN